MNQTTNQVAHVHGHEIPMKCGCLRSGEYICAEHSGWIPTAPELDTEISRRREVEEREISALASHAEPANAIGWVQFFCHECDAVETIRGTARELAEKIYNLNWMLMFNNVLCPECQNPKHNESDEPVRPEPVGSYSKPWRGRS